MSIESASKDVFTTDKSSVVEGFTVSIETDERIGTELAMVIGLEATIAPKSVPSLGVTSTFQFSPFSV